MTERDLVLLPLAGKQRPAVVLHIVEERAVGNYRPHMEHVEVQPESREGKALGLSKPTYFYPTNVVVALNSTLQATPRRCPPGLFLDLRALAEWSKHP